jgi:dGTPase
MYRTREQLEQIELDTLAPYAAMSRYSRGRRHPDHEPDYRTAFQRDRDRVVHAAAFRRLEYKTQVFVNDLGDYYRTRLTHTLEVAQIGRTMARALAINEDLVEVICLAHDLGHPPFGHSGETALNALLSDHGGFNHNHQSYRVVSELERRYPRWPGLNLTFETLEGIAKHETEYDLSLVAGFDYDKRGGLEAQVANIADELAYNAHDLDDGLQSGLITPRQLKDLEIWQLLCERLGWSDDELDEVTRHRFIREQIGLQVDDVLRTTHAALEELQPQSADDIKNLSANIVAHSEQFKAYNRALKAFLYENMYYHPSVVRMSKRAERFINDLFMSFVSEPRQLPREFQQQVAENGLHRVVGDFIASMTVRSALQEYSRLFDPLTRP